MKLKKVFLPLFASIMVLPFLSQNNVSEAKAGSNTLYLEDLIQNIHNNNLDDVLDSPLFSYGIRHGSISTNSGAGQGKILPGCVKFDEKDSAGNYISSSEYPAYIKSDGTTICSADDDRFIVKIVALENIEIHTSIDNWNIDPNAYDSVINHYILDDYNETGLTKFPDPFSSINDLINSNKDTFDQIFTVDKGQVFYWQWGFQWGPKDNYREFNIGKSTCGFKFEISENTYKQKTVKNEEYRYLDLIEQSANISGNDLIPGKTTYDPNQTLAEIGFRHGDVAKNQIEFFSTHTPTSLGTPNDNEPKTTFMQNWRMSSVNGDGAIVQIKALEKIRLNINRSFLGNDALSGATVNIYKNKVLVHSHEFTGSGSSASDFNYSLVLEKDDVLHWEMIHYGIGFSIVSMGDDGTQYTSLPSFKAIEFGNLIEHSLDNNQIAQNMISSGKSEIDIEDSLGRIKLFNGLRENNTLVPATIGSGFVGNANAKIKSNGDIELQPNSSITFEVSTKFDIAVYLNFLSINSTSSLGINAYQFVKKLGKTHRLFNLVDVNDEKLLELNDPLILTRNDVVYIEFVSRETSVLFSQFKGLTIIEKAIGDGLINEYPYYEANDFSSEITLTHKEITFETGRTRSKPIIARDYEISLVTGLVSEEKKDSSYPFNYISYESGEYLEGDITPSVLLTGDGSKFDGDNFAAVEDYRIKTSKANSTIYKIKATKNTKLMLHHGATNSGWIKDTPEEKPEIYFVYLQSNGTQYKQLDKKEVVSNTNPEDAFAFNFDLKSGDTAYLAFQSDAAYQRNLDIAFSFTSDPTLYNEESRNEIFSDSQTNLFSYDVISDMIRNDCNPVIYEESIEINFCHGDVKAPLQFIKSECTGDGSGSAYDALYTGGEAANKAGFQRWQIKAGRLSDNAIMVFKALKNVHLTLKNDATKESWASFSSFKYYIVDVDNFFDYKEERYVSSDLEADYFGYDVNLLAGQSLVICYQSNDDSSHAVVDLVYKIMVDTTTFDPTKVNDFGAARNLDKVKNIYKNELHDRFDGLNSDDYSLSNWSKIETYVEDYDLGIDVLTDKESVYALYEACVDGINSTLTKEGESLLLEQTKKSSLFEARMLIEKNKQYFLDKTISSIEKRYSALEWKINASKSLTSIKVALLNFETYVNNAPHDKTNLQNGLTIGFSVFGVLLIGVIAITYVIKKNSRKKLLVVGRSSSTLKFENSVEDLTPRKGLKWKAFVSYMKKYWPLYLMLLPMVVYLFIFSYIPMGGLSLAFKDFDFRQGIWASPWATTDGNLDLFKYFKQLFDNPEFIDSFLITLKISGLRLLCGFFIPIILTILLTEIKSKKFSKGFQIISYLPHFISWVVIYGILIALTTSGSPVQNFFASILGKEVGFFSDPDVFLWLVIFSNIWKEAGWSTIIYFAAAASINPELYEAANIDGAKRWKRILKITLPGLIPAISINLILQASGFVFGGFDQIFALTGNGVNQSILPYVNITEIFLYKAGITSFEYSLATVVGLFNSVISLVLVLASNFIIKKIGGDGLW